MDQKSPAWKAGLQPNQLITHINGRNITGLQHVEVLPLMASRHNHSITISAVHLDSTGIHKVKRTEAFGKGRRIGKPSRQHSSTSGKKRPPHLMHFLRNEAGQTTLESPVKVSPPTIPHIPSPSHHSQTFGEHVHWRSLDGQRKLSSLTTNWTYAGPSMYRSPSPTTEPVSPSFSPPLSNPLQRQELSTAGHKLTTHKRSINETKQPSALSSQLSESTSPLLKHPAFKESGSDAQPLQKTIELGSLEEATTIF